MPDDRDDGLPPITADDVDGAKKIFELIDGVLYIDGVEHGGGPHARLLLALIAHPPAADASALDAPITSEEFAAAGELRVELVDGDLYVGGRPLGHGALAHAVLTPRRSPEAAATLAATLAAHEAADPTRLHLAERLARMEAAERTAGAGVAPSYEELVVLVAALPGPP